METETYKVSLLDDGTMDTVVEVTDKASGITREFRYDCELTGDYRDESGALDEASFFADVVITDAESDEQWGRWGEE